MHRSLTAVLAADIVGYSRLMHEDAAGTLATLKRLRAEIMGPAVAASRGKLVKNMGDGWIFTFGSVTDAVECAMQVQDRLKIDGAMQVRSGIHIGDVTREDEDVYGEGVNIAARLQDIAEPGALAISDPVYGLLDGTLQPSFDDAGERALKNIPRPVRIWSRGGDVAGQSAALEVAGFPRLTIRPVTTSDARPEVRELAAALSGDIGYYFDGIRWLTARVSQQADGHGYCLTCTLRAAGSRLRLEARLLSPEGTTVISEKFDGDLEDAFDWQDSCVSRLGALTVNTILRSENDTTEALAEDKRTAEQWYLLSLSRGGTDAEGCRHNLDCVSRAIQLQPDNGFFYAEALTVLTSAITMGYRDRLADHPDEMDNWSRQVDRLEPQQSPARVHLVLGQLMLGADVAIVRSGIHLLLRQLPFDFSIQIWAGVLHIYLGEPEAAIELLKRVRDRFFLHPFMPAVCGMIGLGYIQSSNDRAALPFIEEAIALNPEFSGAWAFRAAAYANLGQPDEARSSMLRLAEILPEEKIPDGVRFRGFVDTPQTQRYFKGIRKARALN